MIHPSDRSPFRKDGLASASQGNGISLGPLDRLLALRPLASLPPTAALSSLSSLSSLSALPAATGLPPPAALAAATGIQPLAWFMPILAKPAMSASSLLSAAIGPGPAAATGGILASLTDHLAEPVRLATLILAVLTVLLWMGASGLSLVERAASRRLSHWFGWRSVLITGWIGTPVHEFSHLAACKILGLRVIDYKLFQPDPRTATLGYVHYVQEGSGLAKALRRAVVGMAPLAVGMAVLTAGWIWIVGLQPAGLAQPSLSWAKTPMLLGRSLLATVIRPFTRLGPGSWKLWLWCYAALSVGVHMAPSRTDLKNAAWGLVIAWGLALLALVLVGAFSSPARVATTAVAALAAMGSVLVWTMALGLVYLGLVWIAVRLAAR